jgi:uncharacterized membrane protein
MRGAQAFSLCSFKKHTGSSKKYSHSFQKKTLKALACFSAELPSQRASDETRFFNTTRATKRNLLAGFLAQPRPGYSIVIIVAGGLPNLVILSIIS